MVPLAIETMLDTLEPNTSMGAPFLLDFKQAFYKAVQDTLGYVLDKSNNFLKAACLHPGIACLLPLFVDEDVIDECWESICADASVLHDEYTQFLDATTTFYRGSLPTPSMKRPFPP